MLKLSDFHKVEANNKNGRKSGAIRMHINQNKYLNFSKACSAALDNAERYEILVNDECTMLLLKADVKGSGKRTKSGLTFGRKALVEKIIRKYSPDNQAPSFLGHYEFNLDGVLFDLRKVEGEEN